MDLTNFKTTRSLDMNGKRVLIRVDINVPLTDGRVTDDTRIRAIVPTVREVLDKGGRPILMAHLGRPKGKPVPELSLEMLRAPLEAAIGSPVVFAKDDACHSAREWSRDLKPGEVLLLENVRFHPGEENNTPEFAAELAALGDVYINDAFSASHRAHASTEGVAHLLPSAAGQQMETEINALQSALENPQRPTVAVVGGAKVSTKIAVLENLVEKVDNLIIGGGMANTFLQALGIEIGKSLSEPDFAATVEKIISRARDENCEIHLPIDAIVACELTNDAATQTVSIENVPQNMMILDVGPETVQGLKSVVEGCKTLVWNGPLGAFEFAPFAQGTVELARAAALQTSSGDLASIAGGGDTVAALNTAGVTDKFTYVSMAGGAFLEWLEGRTLPGVAALAYSHA